MNEMVTGKFNSQSELDIFKVLQAEGNISQKEIANKAGLPKTTVQYACKRLAERAFYGIQAVADLKLFPELPLAIIGFHDLHSMKLQNLKKFLLPRDEVRAFLTGNDSVVMVLIGTSRDALAELVFEIMGKAQARPSIHMLSPGIDKLNFSIPDSILQSLYGKKEKKK